MFHDIPGWVWAIFIGAWATLFGLFILFFTNGEAAAFVVTIAALFAMMAFGLPMTLAAQSQREDQKWSDVIQTRTGPLSVGAAATQIVMIPVAAVIGLVALIVLAM